MGDDFYFSGKIDLNRDFPKWYHHKDWELSDRREDLIFADREKETEVLREANIMNIMIYT